MILRRAAHLALILGLLLSSASAFADVKQGCRCSSSGLPGLAVSLPLVALGAALARRAQR